MCGRGTLVDKASQAAHAERTRVGDYVHLLLEASEEFVKACDEVSARHVEEMEIRQGLRELSTFAREAIDLLCPFADDYGGKTSTRP